MIMLSDALSVVVTQFFRPLQCICPGWKFLITDLAEVAERQHKVFTVLSSLSSRPCLLAELMIGLTHENELVSPKGYTDLSAGIMTGL